jgi:hypothetical protein
MHFFSLCLFFLMLLSTSTLESKSLSKKDQIPTTRLSHSEAEFLQGYIQALIDSHFYEFNVLVCVNNNREVSLYNLPVDARIRSSIIAFVQDLPDIKKVFVQDKIEDDQSHAYENRLIRSRIKGIWFPESTVLFAPIIADPYNPNLSMAYRHGHEIVAKDLVAVSIGDTFPIFRFIRPSFSCQIDIQAAVWALFDLNTSHCDTPQWAELMNADYLAGIPVSFSYHDWSFRLRVYHISTHLGDELMTSLPDIVRVNVSYEGLDLIASFNPDQGQVRVYFGPGIILHSDQSYDMKRLYFQGGFEARLYPFLSFRSNRHGLYGTPFLAFDLQSWQVNHFNFSPTVHLGYEWSKLKNAGRKLRIFGAYHHGNGDGQFFKQKTRYVGAGLSFGF